jgi:tetratricopeptide (TPR) repeat protein
MNKFFKVEIRVLFVLIFFLWNNTEIFSQAKPKETKEAIDLSANTDPNKAFKYRNYRSALEGFKLLETKEPENSEIKLKIGLCYLLGSIDYAKAIPYLKIAAENIKTDYEAIFYLASAFQNNYQFDKAIEYYNKYKEQLQLKNQPTNNDAISKANRAIDTCKNAIELIKTPVDVTFENMGKEFNTVYSELDPFITPNKTTLIFSSNRADGNQCTTPRKSGYTSDLYGSIFKNGKWTRASNLGITVNTPLNERICSINEDGTAIFLYIDNEESSKDGDIYLALAKNKVFDTPFSLKGLVNSKDEESAASITADGSALYFSSDREGGTGKKDLYVAKRLPDQSWGEPKRLSNMVNTPYDEDYPLISSDDKTLYFCSQGHNSMGGLDIFKTEWVDSLNNWSEPENIGYPVNTPEDNFSISFTSKKNEGYIAAIRPEGFGSYDVYRIIFNESNGAPYYVLKGVINNGSSDGINSEVKFSITNKKTKALVGKYNISEKKNGKFAIVLYPGEFTIEIQNDKSLAFTEDIKIMDTNTRGDIVSKNFTLKSSETIAPPKEKTNDKKVPPQKNNGASKPTPNQKK